MNLIIEEIAHHRNGVSGESFDVIKFVCPENGNMIGIVFDLNWIHDHKTQTARQQTWNGRVAVLNRDLLAEGNIRFGENSWRGDHYEQDLRDAIQKKWDEWDAELKRRCAANDVAFDGELLSLDPREAIMNAWDGERPQPVI